MMKTKHYLSILLFVIYNYSSAQSIIYSGQIGAFTNANSFSINPAGFIFVSDIATNEITKLDTLGKTLKSIGGYGWNESSFDFPSHIFATALNVYIADKNNHRIQFFDKDLNFLSEFSTTDKPDDKIKFKYPLCVSVSNQGDLFLLENDNKRILKFNIRGQYQTAIGSFDSGIYSLTNPKKFILTEDLKIMLIDSKLLIIYDQFGNAIKKTSLEFEPISISFAHRAICLNDSKQIMILNNYNSVTGFLDYKIFNPNLEEEISDAIVFHSKLYVLTKTTLNVFNIIN